MDSAQLAERLRWRTYDWLRHKFAKHFGLDIRVNSCPKSLPLRAGLNLNVGSGQYKIQGFQSLDMYSDNYYRSLSSFESLGVVNYNIVTDLLPYKDGEVDNIYCSHVLEHLEFHQTAGFLNECLRVLKPGGVIRIVTPDARRLFDIARLRALKEPKYREDFELNVLDIIGSPDIPRPRPSAPFFDWSWEKVVKYVSQLHFDPSDPGRHIYPWTVETMTAILQEVGFSHVVESLPGNSISSQMSGFDIDVSRHEISMYVEAMKAL